MQQAARVGRHVLFGQMLRLVVPVYVGLCLVGVVPVEQYAALADRIDAKAVRRIGEIDQAAGRWSVDHLPGRRGDACRQVVRRLVTARRGERPDVEQPV
ncbi:hypothetical protein D9M68_995250 [compost metagenome]